MKQRKLRTTIVLLGVLSIVLIVWLELKTVCSSVLAVSLKQVGFQKVSIENFWPGLNDSSVTQFNFHFPTSTGSIRGQIKKLNFAYTLSSLKSGSLDSILLEDGFLSLDPALTESQLPTAVSGKPQSLHLDKIFSGLNSLPFHKVKISHFDIDYSGQDLFLESLDLSTVSEPHLELSAQIPRQFNHKLKFDFIGSEQIRLGTDSNLNGDLLNCDFNAEILSENSLALSDADVCDLKVNTKNYKVNFKKTFFQRQNAESVKFDSLITLISPEFLNGQLKFDIDLNPLLKKARIAINEGNFGNELMKVSGARLDTIIGFSTDISSIEPVRVKISSLNLGIPVQDISAQFNFSLDKLKSFFAKARIAGGIVMLLPAEVSFFEKNWKLSFKATELSLKELLAAYPQKTVEAEGQIDIEFDLIKTPEGFEIHSGHLKTKEGGGFIRVVQDTFSNSHPELSLVMDQLKNFHYDKLEGVIDLDVKGNLVLSLNIQGQNPALNSKRVINLNLKLEDNLFDLAKTIRLINAKH